ncbi:MAG TPA: hypothetical protein VKV24_10420 [Casimicrobiaceae bacterium]|nr:hypothetical protein [Casimicrobiaceae bacterium]
MKLLSALATLIAGCALALVVAHFGWVIFGPAPVQIATPPPADPVGTLVAASLFGGDASTKSPDASGAMLSGDARLLGIVAEPSKQGYAVFRLPSGPVIVGQGQEISPGVKLVSVEPFAITIRDGGGERRFLLAPSKTTSSSTLVPTSAASNGKRATCGPPPGFRGNVVRLNAELLGGLTDDSGPWRTLLAPAAGGLVVREDGGFSAMLGLKAGDRIAQANDIALRVPDDVVAAVIRPLIANQGVRVVGSRAGTTHELWLANIACAG